ncbi:MAG: hypothetical protein ABJE95_14255 [Byssovorax sp.]
MSGKDEAATGEPDYWHKLHAHTVSERDGKNVSVEKMKSSLIARLKDLASKNHCSKQVIGWFGSEGRAGGCQIFGLKKGLPAKDKWDHPAIALTGLQHIDDGALLTLSVLLDPRAQRVLEYSIGIQGQSRKPERYWYARIDLTEKPEGMGLCGHPLLHCHVGETSDEAPPLLAAPSKPAGKAPVFTARVPLPWMMPADALDWLLATVHSPLDRTHTAPAP